MLHPEQECFWKVRVWDQDGKPSGWSEPAALDHGAGRFDWQAKWIGHDEPAAARSLFTRRIVDLVPRRPRRKGGAVGTRYFRQDFELPATTG